MALIGKSIFITCLTISLGTFEYSLIYAEEAKGKVFTNEDLGKYRYPSAKRNSLDDQRDRHEVRPQIDYHELRQRTQQAQEKIETMSRIFELEKQKAALSRQIMDIDKEIQDVSNSKALTTWMKESALKRLREKKEKISRQIMSITAEIQKEYRLADLSRERGLRKNAEESKEVERARNKFQWSPPVENNRGAIDTRTSEYYPWAGSGVINPRTGQFYPDVGGGYINPQTGEFLPKQ